ncbi:MFS transporter [Bauldia sp.]|uniref:MFS transporter n=1 Tax=Bauldia sp. TaxID=2575872 RepID=UPI003BAB0477
MPSHRRDTRRSSAATVFALNGVVMGTFFSRIADLQLAVGLTEAALGIALAGLSIGVFLGSLALSQPIEAHGVRRILMIALPVLAAGPLLVAVFSGGTVSLFALLGVFGFAFAGVNITMNVEADRIEAAQSRRLLNHCHAIWAVGFLGATVVGTVVVAARISLAAHFATVLALVLVVTVAVVWPMRPAPPRAHVGNGPRRRIARPTIGILLIMGFAVSGMWLEGTTRNWSIIYLRDVFEPADWVTTLTLPAIVIFQIVGRLAADRIIDRYGPVLVARVLTAITLVGLVLVVAQLSIAVTLIGFALIGLGISTVVPQAMSAAARLGDRPSSENVAALATLQTLLGLISPPLIGSVASAYGIHTAFMLLLPLPIVALYFARYLRRAG